MKLQTANDTLESTITDSKAFGVLQDDQIYQFLSSRLYSDKIGAVIRELSCNAYDSYLDAGNGLKFKVMLPTTLYPYFSVEDFGVGLSEEEVVSLFGTYMSSNKRDKTNSIGGYGIGSKSPFAYADSFTVVARKDGQEVQYLCFMKNSVPHMTKLSSSETQEPNGVKVQVPVQEEDFRSFQLKASRQLAFFPEESIEIVGDVQAPVVLRESTNYVQYEDNMILNGWYVLQGTVAYQIPTQRDDVFYGVFSNKCMVLKVPMGAVKITPSRESLEFDADTTAAVQSAKDAVLAEYFKEVWESDFENQKVDLQLVKRASSFVSALPSHYVSKIQDPYVDNIQKVASSTFKYDKGVTSCSAYGVTGRSLSSIKTRHEAQPVTGAASRVRHVFLVDTKKNWKKRTASFMHSKGVRYAFSVEQDAKEAAEALGGLEVVKVSEMPEVASAARATGSISATTVKLLTRYNFTNKTVSEQEIKAGFYYLWMYEGGIVDNETAEFRTNCNRLGVCSVDRADIGATYKGKPVYVLQSQNRKLAQYGTNLLKELRTVANSYTMKHITDKLVTPRLAELLGVKHKKSAPLKFLAFRANLNKAEKKAESALKNRVLSVGPVKILRYVEEHGYYGLFLSSDEVDSLREQVYSMAEAYMQQQNNKS